MKKTKLILGIVLIFSSMISAVEAEDGNPCSFKAQESKISKCIKKYVSGKMAVSTIKEISDTFSEKISKKRDGNVSAPHCAQPGSYSLPPPLNSPKDESLKDFLRDNFGA